MHTIPTSNCWKMAEANRVSFLIDAAAYYKAFAEAAENAQQTILITAWDIDGRIFLHPDRPQEDLRHFLWRLLEEKPELHIYVLNWRFHLFYAADRELSPFSDDAWQKHDRLHFEWDSYHPVGACHHQKVVVIDDAIGFVGGLDFTHDRWDTPGHKPHDPRRRDPEGEPYRPFHDAVVMMDGPIAKDLGELVRERWARCTTHNGHATPCEPPLIHSILPWPGVPVDLSKVPIGICRTEPQQGSNLEVREIEAHYLEMIRGAKRFIYVENQYFTATHIIEAFRQVLKRPQGPEIILILPQQCTGWVEEISLGLLRSRAISHLRQEDPHRRLHVYYPFIQGLEPNQYLKVHDKLMITDDLILQLGSANLCNRSMAVDTECDVVIHAIPDSPSYDGIKRLRERLMAEHLGVKASQVEEAVAKSGSLARAISTLNSSARGLMSFDGEVSPLTESLDVALPLVDLKRPIL